MRLPALILLIVLAIPSMSSATPIDTGWDILYAIEYLDGEGFLELLSGSLRARMEDTYAQLAELAELDPNLLQDILDDAGINAAPMDFQWMSLQDFVSRVLDGLSIPDLDTVISEEADLIGRHAEVSFTWSDGYTVEVQMVWEESSWRVTGSPIVADMFR